MGLFDFLGDPAKKWVRETALKLEVDLKQAGLCGVRLGSRPASLSRLGPPSNRHPAKRGYYAWNELGLDAYSDKDILETYSVTVARKDYEPETAPFPGVFLLDGKPVALSGTTRREDIVRLLGEPWHEYSDPDDDEVTLTLWYETRTLEWVFEFLPAGTLATVIVSSPPDLAEETTRRFVKCEKPWPP
ncbi:MAG TPA: hypothetical protein VE981_16540 [Planctomycetota bacterium]|nr:hypothetical protein [Planctomycetota bacterium]